LTEASPSSINIAKLKSPKVVSPLKRTRDHQPDEVPKIKLVRKRKKINGQGAPHLISMVEPPLKSTESVLCLGSLTLNQPNLIAAPSTLHKDPFQGASFPTRVQSQVNNQRGLTTTASML